MLCSDWTILHERSQSPVAQRNKHWDGVSEADYHLAVSWRAAFKMHAFLISFFLLSKYFLRLFHLLPICLIILAFLMIHIIMNL